MRIAINARSVLLANRTGIGRYTYHLLDSLGTVDLRNEYWLYARKKWWDTKRSLPKFPYSHFKTKTDFFGIGLNRSLKGADIYHSPSLDTLDIEGAKIIVTIHDLVYKAYPQGHTSETIDLTERSMRQIVKKADHVICISHNTRKDLHRFFDFPQERSSVIHNGVDHQKFYCLDSVTKEQAKSSLKSWGIAQPFILFVCTIEPRKNLMGLLQTFAELRQKNNFKGDLVVVGMKGWMDESIAPLIESLNIKENIKFLGFVSDEQLRVLYNLAEIFVFPSFYEGFGFPIVEAFACGAAVVTSNTSSCQEIAGEAAVTVNPQDISQMTKAMAQLLEDKGFNQQLRQKALHRAKDFSFDKTAKETLKVYEQLK